MFISITGRGGNTALAGGAQIQIWEVKLGQFNSYFFFVLFTLLTAYLCAMYEMPYSLAHN